MSKLAIACGSCRCLLSVGSRTLCSLEHEQASGGDTKSSFFVELVVFCLTRFCFEPPVVPPTLFKLYQMGVPLLFTLLLNRVIWLLSLSLHQLNKQAALVGCLAHRSQPPLMFTRVCTFVDMGRHQLNCVSR